MRAPMRYIVLPVSIFLLLIQFCNAQYHTISGTVYNSANNQPISNITIEVKNLNSKTITGTNGEYSLKLPDTMKTVTFNNFENMELVEVKYLSNDIFDIYLLNAKLSELSLEQLMNIKIVTATKNQQFINQAPANIIVVTAEQIEARRYRSLLDVLQDLPEFTINDFVNTDNRNIISMRGYDDQSKFLILIDGLRISNADGEVMPIMENYPVHFAKQIEIVYGPASALYGADAMAGVINIISKEISETKKFEIEASSSLGMYGMINSTVNGGFRFKKENSFYFSSQMYSENLAPIENVVLDTANFNLLAQQTGQFNTIYGPMSPQTPYSTKLEYPMAASNLYATLKLGNYSFNVFTNMSKTSSSFPSTGNNAIYNKDVFFKNVLFAWNGNYTKTIENLILNSKLSSNIFKISPKSNYRNTFSNLEPAYKYGFENMWVIEQNLSWQPNSAFNISGGISFSLSGAIPKTADLEEPIDDNVAIKGILLGTPLPNNPEGISDEIYFLRYTNTGAYFQIQWQLKENISLTVGSRYDYNSRYGSTFNPRFGLSVSPGPKSTIKALYGSSFLAPSPIAAYQHYGTFTSDDLGETYQSSFWHLPNPELNPIFSKTAELSALQYIGSNFSISFSTYYIWLTNLFSFVPDEGNTNYYNGKYLGWDVGYIEVTINQGKQRNYGCTGGIVYSFSKKNFKLKTYAYISFVDAVIETNYTDILNNQNTKYAQARLITPLSARAGFDLYKGKFILSPRLIVMGKQAGADFKDPSAPDKRITINGYSLLNVSISYQPAKYISVYVVANNVLNSRYACTFRGVTANSTSYMYGAPQQPIRISAGVNLKF